MTKNENSKSAIGGIKNVAKEAAETLDVVSFVMLVLLGEMIATVCFFKYVDVFPMIAISLLCVLGTVLVSCIVLSIARLLCYWAKEYYQNGVNYHRL